MSLFNTFVEAFKKAAGKSAIDTKELARNSGGSLGPAPASSAGSFQPIRSAPVTPPGPGGEVDASVAGIAPPVASSNEEPVQEETMPGDKPASIEGAEGRTPPKEAPFNPVEVTFPKPPAQGAGIAGTPESKSGSDTFGKLGDLKGESVPLDSVSSESSDPEEGGEVSEATKTNLDPAFVRRLRTIDDGAVVEGGDTPEFAEFSEEGPRRRPLTVIEEEGEDPPEGGQGGSQLNPNDHGEGSGTEGETQLVGLVDRRGGTIHISDPFKVQLEEVLVSPPVAPGGVPIPYPLVDDGDGARATESFLGNKGWPPGKGGGGNTLDAEIGEPAESRSDTFADVARKARADVSSEPPPNLSAEDRGFVDDIARKAGEGQKDFLKIEMKEAFISREASLGIDGESVHKDHKGEIETLQRVRAGNLPDDDDFESSSLLDLRPEAAVKEMRPGLAGGVADDLDLDLDDVDADTDESEL